MNKTDSFISPFASDVCGVRVEQEAGGAAVAAEGGQGRGEARHLGLPRPPHPPAGEEAGYIQQFNGGETVIQPENYL